MNKQDAIRHTSSCADATEPGLLSVEQAEQHIFDLIQPLHCAERVDIRRALGRTLADDVRSTINVPPHVNSAMDGYAIRAVDIPGISRRMAQRSSQLRARHWLEHLLPAASKPVNVSAS